MIENKVLLLNSDFRPLVFVSWDRALRLKFRKKVDVISIWDKIHINSCENSYVLPSVIRLKTYVPYHGLNSNFSKRLVKERDGYVCQYCEKYLKKHEATIDHIIPKSKNGNTTYDNCVTACQTCNNKKQNRLLKETNLTLLSSPLTPTPKNILMIRKNHNALKIHPHWKYYIK